MTSFNYDVVDLDRIDQNPYCPHGKLRFEYKDVRRWLIFECF